MSKNSCYIVKLTYCLDRLVVTFYLFSFFFHCRFTYGSKIKQLVLIKIFVLPRCLSLTWQDLNVPMQQMPRGLVL